VCGYCGERWVDADLVRHLQLAFQGSDKLGRRIQGQVGGLGEKMNRKKGVTDRPFFLRSSFTVRQEKDVK